MALSCLGIRPRLKKCSILIQFHANISLLENPAFFASEPIANPYLPNTVKKDWLEGSFDDLNGFRKAWPKL